MTLIYKKNHKITYMKATESRWRRQVVPPLDRDPGILYLE